MVHSMQDRNRLVASSEALLDRRKRPFSGTFSSKRLRELNRTKYRAQSNSNLNIINQDTATTLQETTAFTSNDFT